MTKHSKLIGSLFFLHGILVCFIISTIISANPEMNIVLVAAGLSFGILFIIGGYGLVMGMHWAYKVMFPVAILSLLSFPFGTALALYYFWFTNKYVIKKT